MGTVVSEGDAGAAGVGVGDRVLETGASVGAGNVAGGPDAAGGVEGELTVGEAMGWEALVGSPGARVSVGADTTVGDSGEHANRSRAMPARKTRMVFFMANGDSGGAGTTG